MQKMKSHAMAMIMGLMSLSAASAHAAEYIDGPQNRTIRDGMHSCKVGYYIAGIHYKDKKLLCTNNLGTGYVAGDERISFENLVPYWTYAVYDSEGHYQGTRTVSMRVCPRGMAATGIHVDRGLIKCAPADIQSTFFDFNTRRYGMASCPEGTLATGLHVDNAHSQCGRD